MANDGILLETGTNEVEILEFLIDGQGFGVNVAKIQGIVQYDEEKVTRMPSVPYTVLGVLMHRGTTIPLIDLRQVFEREAPNVLCTEAEDDSSEIESVNETKILLVMEFNQVNIAAVVDGVDRIHRVSWSHFEPLSDIISDSESIFTGSVNINQHEILIADMEKIVSNLLPMSTIPTLQAAEISEDLALIRQQKQIYLADDSKTVRDHLSEFLIAESFTNLTIFENGMAAYTRIAEIKANLAKGDQSDQLPEILISDIEMPQMDGFSLCRRIREELGLYDIKVIIFSSLITNEITKKCNQVQANHTIAKPQFRELIYLLDGVDIPEGDNTGPPEEEIPQAVA